ncbi:MULTISPECIES: hypothetical protein [unclassified Hyphomonas]|jgi:hypothetical protein|uniref:hypothetical protein n=1 Tax=unclassified Hyphomonas TaxID=2630699 RepID=UPI000458A08B|nr:MULTISPECIES: hypothetical protein [unclassified Hyphomonas]KCZ45718.1 hypothetical protein HY17_12405 [Hyphomonas sp. CY54-11-8]RAN42143.1 hypothetical protein HY26_00850 [Hyphomonas sp. GM-8P]
MRPAFLIALPLFALPAFAETPLEAALSAPAEGPAYKFDLKLEGDDLNAEAQVDPSLPEGERLVLISPAADTLEGDAAERYADLKANTSGDKIWCSSFKENIPADAKMISESGEAAVYSFTPLPGDDEETAKVYKHLTGRVTVSKDAPGILAFEMFAEKPFKPAMVAKIDSFSMKANCARAPDGRTYIQAFALDISGNAMMQPFSQSERREVTNLVALPDSADTALGQR